MIATSAIVFGLVVLNAVFVAAEFAIVAAPRSAIDALAVRNRLARVVQRILREPRRQDRYVATAQIGITVASLGLGMFGEHAIAGWIEAWLGDRGLAGWILAHGFATIAAVAVLTYIHIVLGEMVPKALALRHAASIALWITPPMLWVQGALLPLVVTLNALGDAVLKPLGFRRQAQHADQYYTPEELQLVVQESEERGALRADAGQMLRELFEFGDLTAGEAMVPRVRISGIAVGATPADLRGLLGRSPHTRYPVYEDDLDHIVGMVHIKDLLRLLLNDQPLSAAHARPAPVVPETAALDSVLTRLRRDGTQMAIVIDEHGGTAGILTLEDLFEEVVGEIDETPGAPATPRRDAQGRVRVPGTLRLDELGQLFDLDLSHEDVDSVSGLVLTMLGRPPRVGDRVRFGRLQFDVTAVKGRGVDQCAVKLIQ
ncbi:MAG: HlyC/CorC family transporter [Acidobacteria bacterium]|nr:MAG: HlyC/CorC family transporter [Acidobacteriota bacterium]